MCAVEQRRAWIRIMTNSVGFGFEPGCKSFQKFRIRTGLDSVWSRL